MAVALGVAMNTSRAYLALTFSLAALACGVETEPPPVVGDVGDTSGSELKVACNLSRDQIMSGASGGRATALERGFSWYDQQVSYSQSSQHEGYRTDCSGFVSMCWELGTSYTTANFINDTGEWSSLGSFSELQPADAMVYRSGGAGHIVMFLGWNDSAQTQACVLEQASTAEDMQFRARTVDSLESSGYHAIRATKFGSGGPTDNPTDPGTGTGGGSGGDCQCDAECSSYGDCCSTCGGSGSGGSGSGGAGSGGSSGGGACSCESDCSDYGDCCTGCGTGGSGSGSGSGGSGGGGQCYCDAECEAFGDCCTPGCGSGGGGSGGSSGGGSGGSSGGGYCSCESDCSYYGDCCSDCF
jgi:hypothetical protein